MPSNHNTLLCHYRYDPLDRLVGCMPSTPSGAQRFYQKDRLATEIHDGVQHSIMQHEDQLLAQQQRRIGTVETRLLATNQQRSVLNLLDASGPQPIAHTPYGHRPLASGLLSLLGFNGERPDPVTGCYLLGNGYRAFNPVLMRFNSPDSWSPFGEGGLNAYTYCVGDPVNRSDPTGHVPPFLYSGTATKLANNVLMFVRKEGKHNILHLDLHGDIGLVKFANETLDAKQLVRKLASNNVNFNEFDEAHLAVCFSANQDTDNSPALAQSFANLTELKTTGYNGRVFPTDVINTRKTSRPGTEITLKDYSIAAENPFKRSHEEHNNFNYAPVTFTPQKIPSKNENIRKKR